MINIDYDKCKKCGICVKVCQWSVLEELDGMPIIMNANNCKECLTCVNKCPTKAIEIKNG